MSKSSHNSVKSTVATITPKNSKNNGMAKNKPNTLLTTKNSIKNKILTNSMGANINVSKYKEEIKKLEEKRLILEVAYELVNDSFTVK